MTVPASFGPLPFSLIVWAGQMVAFHAVGLGFEWVDRSGVFTRFKMRPPDRMSYAAMLPRVLFNQVFVLLPAMLACEWAGLAFTGAPHLSLVWFVAALPLMAVGHDVVQYAGHAWLLHHPRLAWLGHRIHHSITASRSIGAAYASVPDFILNIVLPYLIPLILIGGGGTDIAFHLIVAALGAVGGLYEHSGYDFAVLLKRGGLVSSHAHAEHHRRWKVSFSDGFGSPGLCDTLFRTRWDLR
jgi:sterol desaturase/sphingolipid hydroxylase (fatty acid hydroxylase superfamily)